MFHIIKYGRSSTDTALSADSVLILIPLEYELQGASYHFAFDSSGVFIYINAFSMLFSLLKHIYSSIRFVIY